MAMTDPVGDLLTRIRNGQAARLDSVTVPASRMRSNVLDVLQREGYIRGWFEEELRKGVKELRIELKYDNGQGFKCVCPQGNNGLNSCDDKNLILGSASFVTGTFGLVCAAKCVQDLIG